MSYIAYMKRAKNRTIKGMFDMTQKRNAKNVEKNDDIKLSHDDDIMKMIVKTCAKNTSKRDYTNVDFNAIRTLRDIVKNDTTTQRVKKLTRSKMRQKHDYYLRDERV